jgi:hypothetical protein
MRVIGFRRLAANHRLLAALILTAALMVRILMPAGFMPVVEQGRITIVFCSGIAPQPAPMAMPGMAHSAMAGMSHGAMAPHAPTSREAPGGSKVDAPCAFAGLAMPALSGADPFLLAATLAFLMVLAIWAPERRSFQAAVRLRPPLRGPPARA